ncbi:MAG: KTSC domain-containing protein [Desulfobacterales bacterium]|nr:KTSC domain-containing protein [Desulfobacterales bacterium]
MERVPVQSSSLASVGYDSSTSTLEIEFLNGSIYQYFGIPAYIHEGLMNAASKGTYLDQNIKKAGYSYTKVG